ncbi:MAG: prepilin-type N-terminal cleavage/methylation domain-containing protein [Victivallaceae bacterium]|nr:prepilin-type N-terminal cleavage/methylation domain-containing protein [Victivallaceae bacterium]
MRNDSSIAAFTLIEMITVMAIICIIAAMVIPVFRNIDGRPACEQLADSIIDAANQARNLALRERRFVTMYIPGGVGRAYETPGFSDDAAFEGRPYEYKLASTRLMFSEKNGYRPVPIKWAQASWSRPVTGAKVALMTDQESDVPIPGGNWPKQKITDMDGAGAGDGEYTFSPYGGIVDHAGSAYLVVATCKFNGATIVYPVASTSANPSDFVIVKIDCLTGEATRFVKK